MPTLKQLLSPTTSIAKKVLLGNILILLFAIGVSLYTLQQFHEVAESNVKRNQIIEARRTARELDVDVLRLIVNLHYFIDTKDEAYIAQIEQGRAKADTLRQQLRNKTKIPEVTEKLNAYERILPERRKLAQQIITEIQSGKGENDIQVMLSQRRALDNQAREYLHEIVAIEDSAALRALSRAEELTAEARRNVLLVYIPFVGIVFAIGVLIAGTITRPLSTMEKLTKRIGQGDFSLSEASQTDDEVGRLERSLAAMTKDLAELDRSKSEFISLVSHQLRTPATAVKQSLGLIIEGFVDKNLVKKSELIAMAYDSNEEQLQIIDDILNVAKVDAGKLELHQGPIDLNEVAESAVKQLQGNAKEKKHTLHLHKATVPVSLTGDKLKISMVIENLVSNAIKYTPEGGEISVEVAAKDDESIISISDNGIGISAAEQQKLFTKFGRISNDFTVKVQGTGLGLFLAKKFIELHNGMIEVHSEPGNGTTFVVKLPKEKHGKNSYN